ncbi:MAG TPA: hypothetical protein VLG11_01830 [Candidatus Saccharimonadales bacterium]|nr:hypothetical protein [Candidatus Saccharimonadales bacterium]
MARRTQISGMYQSERSSLFRVKAKLEQCGIQVIHPLSDGFIFTKKSAAPTVVSALWTPYETNLDYFQAIALDDFYTVSNDDGFISDSMARGILYAILLGKPVVFLHKPQFESGVQGRMQQLIGRQLPKMHVTDLLALTGVELEQTLTSLGMPVDYQLTPGEVHAIQREVRSYFRSLLPKRATIAISRPLRVTATA